jgi:hypothetical protein
MTNARRVLTVLLALSLTLVLSPMSPAAASVKTLGYHCEGVRAVRCAWVNHDTTNNRVRGYGSVRDTTSGSDAVRVSVTLFRWNSSYDRFEPVSSGGPQSDYEFVQAYTGLVTCGDGQVFRADAVWEWNGTDAGVVRSGSAVTSYC